MEKHPILHLTKVILELHCYNVSDVFYFERLYGANV